MKLTFEIVKEAALEVLRYCNYSEVSLKAFEGDLRRFDRYLKSKGTDDYRDVKEKDYYDYMEYARKVSKEGVKDSTLNHYGSDLRTVFRVLWEEGKILENPFAGADSIRTVESIRERILSEEETEKFLEACEEDTPRGMLERTMIEVLYGTGIRAREIVRLNVYDYFPEDKVLFIRQGKGKKDRIAPVGERLAKRIDYYLKHVRRHFIGPLTRKDRNVKDAFFFSSIGSRMRQASLMVFMRKIAEKSGIGKQVSPHVLRHSFATHLIRRGADEREVQLLLGHTSLSTTSVYLNFSTKDLKDIYQKYHPLENELYFDVRAKESYIFDWKERNC